MSKRIQYPNGSIGFASDKVAEALAKRKGHKILGDAGAEIKADKDAKKAEAEKKAASERKALEEKAVAAGLGTAEEVSKIPTAELAELLKKGDA